MRFINFAIVRFCFCLICGTLSARVFPSFPFPFLPIISIVVLVVIWFISKRRVFQGLFFGIITYFCFYSFGAANYQLRLPIYRTTHYSHFSTNEISVLSLSLKVILKPNNYYKKYIAEVHQINNTEATGKILLSIKVDSSDSSLRIDDKLLLLAKIDPIPKALNPHQFDYSKYMENLDVYGQIRIDKGQILERSDGMRTARGRANELRSFLISKLSESIIAKKQRSIIQALVLGQRNEIDREMYKSYAAAGAVHILAVSGLHVGIIYFLLRFLTRPLTNLPQGKLFRSILIIIILWAFAIITGLSPSVTRAVTMFSFFGMASMLNRPTNSINTLFLSLFFLLILNPKWLFHVGFQLSYLAVFFIIWVQPKLAELYRPKNFIARLVWGICTVSLAAQLGVTPLSLYYFHQFPGLFFVSNLVILPFLSTIVSIGIMVIALAAFGILPEWLAHSYDAIIRKMNEFIKWMAQQDNFIITDIHFNEYHLLGSYLFICLVVLLFRNYSFRRLQLVLGSSAVFILLLILNSFVHNQHRFIIFHKPRESILGIQKPRALEIYKNDSLKQLKNLFPVRSFRVAINTKYYSEETIPNVMSFKDRMLLVVDSASIYPSSFKADIILLRESPKLSLERMIDSLNPRIIIADGSNYRSIVARWKKTCETKKLPFHYTVEKGAFILE